MFREDIIREDGYFIDWDIIEKKAGLEEKLGQFLEFGQSIIKETDGLFPDGMSVLNGQVIMNGEVGKRKKGGTD